MVSWTDYSPGHGDINQMRARLAGDDEDGSAKEGGLAITAYNYTQFQSLSEQERKGIESALLRYCELDTLAMVMPVQGLFELRCVGNCLNGGQKRIHLIQRIYTNGGE